MGPPSAKPCQCKLYNYLATAMKSYNAFHLLNFYSMRRYCFPAILGSHGALPELVQGTATVLLYPYRQGIF